MEGAASDFSSDGSSYKPFTEKVTSLLLSRAPCEKSIRYVLGGGALAASEELMSYSLRSQYGVFFTPEDITRSAVEHFRHEIASSASFYDPACGAGNLLLGVAKEYKLGRTLVETVRLGVVTGGFLACGVGEGRMLAFASLRYAQHLTSFRLNAEARRKIPFGVEA